MVQTQSSAVVPQKVYRPDGIWRIIYLFIPAFSLALGAILLVVALSKTQNTAIRAVLLAGAGIMALLGVLLFLGFQRVHLVTSSQGVILYGVGYKVYTPWNNIKELGADWYGGNDEYEGFLFYRPAVFGLSVEEGMRQQVPVIQGWILLAVPMSRYTYMLPLVGFLNDYTRQELLEDAKKYAHGTF